MPITLTGDFKAGNLYRHDISLHMRRRPHRLLVSLHDPISGKTLNGRAEVSFRRLRSAATEKVGVEPRP